MTIEPKNPEAARLIKRFHVVQRAKSESRHWKRESYKDYLQTKLWKTIRSRALKNADFSCQICKSTNRLQVHHNTYERLGSELNSDMIVVCDNCHRMIHGLDHKGEAGY